MNNDVAELVWYPTGTVNPHHPFTAEAARLLMAHHLVIGKRLTDKLVSIEDDKGNPVFTLSLDIGLEDLENLLRYADHRFQQGDELGRTVVQQTIVRALGFKLE